MENKEFQEDALTQAESNSVKRRAGCACGGGPVYEIATDVDGNILPFAEAYPNAPRLMKKIALYFQGGNN